MTSFLGWKLVLATGTYAVRDTRSYTRFRSGGRGCRVSGAVSEPVWVSCSRLDRQKKVERCLERIELRKIVQMSSKAMGVDKLVDRSKASALLRAPLRNLADGDNSVKVPAKWKYSYLPSSAVL